MAIIIPRYHHGYLRETTQLRKRERVSLPVPVGRQIEMKIADFAVEEKIVEGNPQ